MKIKSTLLSICVISVFAGMSIPASADDGEYCREYTRTVTIGGKITEAYGTACLQPDGSWKIVSESQEEDTDTVVEYNTVYKTSTPRTVVLLDRDFWFSRPLETRKVVHVSDSPHYWKGHGHHKHHNYPHH